MTNAENLKRFRTMMLDKEVGAFKAVMRRDSERRGEEMKRLCDVRGERYIADLKRLATRDGSRVRSAPRIIVEIRLK
jgi:hypothetical protein